MTTFIYDAGALIAADRRDRDFWADHATLLEDGLIPEVPAPVVAQVSRSPQQAQLRRLLNGCKVLVLDEHGAHQIGDVLRRARKTDIADASVILAAFDQPNPVIVTGDRRDITQMADAVDLSVTIVDV